MMMKYAILTLCLILLMAALVLGCSMDMDSTIEIQNQEDPSPDTQENLLVEEKEQFLSLYFVDPAEKYLFPLNFAHPQVISPQDLVRYLSIGPMRKEWGKSPIPAGVTVKGVDVVGERVLVNLATAGTFKEFQPGEEELMVKSLVYTLTSLETVSRVGFLQEGQSPKEPFSLLQQQALFNPEDLPLNPLTPIEKDDDLCLIWLSNRDSMYMVPVSLPLHKDIEGLHDRASIILEALVGEPESPYDLLTPFPAGIEILDLRIENGTATVDFNEFLVTHHIGGSFQEWALLNSLVLTLTEIEGIEEVQILVEGRREEAALGHMATDKPLIRGVVNWVLME